MRIPTFVSVRCAMGLGNSGYGLDFHRGDKDDEARERRGGGAEAPQEIL